MTTVTEHFKINQSVPFVDVNVHDDNRLFLDPFAIRMGIGPSKVATAANYCTSTFFDEVVRYAVATNPTSRAQGLRMLQQFEEPRETRLGYAEDGFNGHGGADGVGEHIWDVLTGDAEVLVRVGVLKRIEDLPMFVDGVGNDITSDLTTRVVYQPLVDFTNEMVMAIPELAAGTGAQSFVRQVWDPARLGWTRRSVSLPTVNGQPLLLIPNEWVRHDLTLNANRFYDTELLSHVQNQRAVYSRDGRLLKTPKDRLRQEPDLNRSYETIMTVVERAYGNDQVDLVEQFKRFAQERYKATTPEQIERRTA